MPNHRSIEVPPKQHLADLKNMFTVKDIAHLYQVATRTAQLWLRMRDLTDPSRDRIPRNEQRPLYDAIISGKTTFEEASEKYKTTPEIVRDYLLKFGPLPTARIRPRKPYIQPVPDAERDEYIRLYYLGMIDFEDISEMLDIPVSHAKKMIRSNSATFFERPSDEELEEVADLPIHLKCEHFAEFNPHVVGRWYQDLNRKKRKREGVTA